jgi:hypothetical protein
LTANELGALWARAACDSVAKANFIVVAAITKLIEGVASSLTWGNDAGANCGRKKQKGAGSRLRPLASHTPVSYGLPAS